MLCFVRPPVQDCKIKESLQFDTLCVIVCSAGGGTAKSQGSGENNVSVTEEPRGRMCSDEGEKHQDWDAGQEREGVDCIST